MVLASLGRNPVCLTCSTIDEVKLAIREHLASTIDIDARLYVFRGERVPLSVSNPDKFDPELVLGDGERVRIFDTLSRLPNSEELQSGALMELSADFEEPEKSDSLEFDS